MTRQAIRPDFDAVVDLTPARDHVAETAYALVKRTYAVTPAGLVPAKAEPLLHDIRPSPTGDLPETLPVGSDFWPYKRLTDVMIAGAACAPGGRPIQRMEVRCEIAKHQKRIAVIGTRRIEWRADGTPHIGPAETFTTMPVDMAHAYGGIDTRVPYPAIRSLLEALSLAADHPGAYPRNDEGKGYYVVPERFDGIELPNLENPNDLLTDERLVIGDPSRWGRQPVPWTFDWQPPHTFPRCAFLHQRPRYPVNVQELTEVHMGILNAEYEQFLDRMPRPGEDMAYEVFADRYYQEASHALQLSPLEPGMPLRVHGMRPQGDALAFSIPSPPRIDIVFEGATEQVWPMISNLVIVPAESRVLITYCARSGRLPRKIIPGLHRDIPLSLLVDRAPAAVYAPPPVPREEDHG